MAGSFARRVAVSTLLAPFLLVPAALAGGPAGATAAAWVPHAAPLPANAVTGSHEQALLRSVACWRGLCVAGGSYVDGTGLQQAVVLVRSHGTWSPSEVLPAGSTSATVSSVACGPTQCAAVGSYDVAGSGSEPLVLVESGGTWSMPTLTGGTTSGTQLNAVACSKALGCVGFGTGIVVDDVSGTWTVTSLAPPVGFHGTPGSPAPATLVAATCAKTCVAVGSSYLGGDPGNYGQGAVFVQGAGTAWSDRAAPLPANALAYTDAERAALTGVSCAGGSCVAVGSYITSNLPVRTDGLVEARVPKGRWSDAQAPQPTGSASTLSSVACTSSTSCVAVGGFTSASTVPQNLVLAGAAATGWTATAPAPPAGGTSSTGLTSVSCGSSSLCAATGLYSGTGFQTVGELLTGAGSTWAAQTAPALKGSVAASPAAVSCTAVSCVAAGAATLKVYPYEKALVETYRA